MPKFKLLILGIILTVNAIAVPGLKISRSKSKSKDLSTFFPSLPIFNPLH